MYEWLKVFHIISVISWMAGLLYLPRLMMYHRGKKAGSDASETFIIMERRLIKIIMNPAMISSWVFGILLAWQNNLWNEGWFMAKMFLAILLSAQHGFCAIWVKQFAVDKRPHSKNFFRMINEIPAIIMIMIIILVEIQP